MFAEGSFDVHAQNGLHVQLHHTPLLCHNINLPLGCIKSWAMLWVFFWAFVMYTLPTVHHRCQQADMLVESL